MKKILSIIFLGAALFGTTSCVSEEDLLFDKSAAERLNEASSLYSQRLLDSPHGWALEYYAHSTTDEDDPMKGAGFLMMTKFDKDKSVLVAMNNHLTYYYYKEDRSAWEVITDNGPVLSFNTHNDVLHTFSIPEDVPGTAEDETGKGLEGDYEFVMVDVPEGGDYITLKGKKRGAYSRLTKLEEETDFKEYLTDVRTFTDKMFNPKAPNHNIITIGENRYNMIMAQDGGLYGIVKMWPEGTDSTFTKEVLPMIVTRHGVKDAYTYNVRFRSAIKGANDAAEQEFVYNAASQSFSGKADSKCSIAGPNPNDFMAERLKANATLTFTANMDASDDITSALTAIKNDFAAVKYTFNNVKFRNSEQGFRAAVAYRNAKKQNVTTYYNFNWKQNTDGSISFEYVSPADESGETLLKSLPSIAEFFKVISDKYNVKSYDNAMDVTTVVFDAGSKNFVNSPVY